MLPWPGVGGTEHATLRLVAASRRVGFEGIAFCMESAAPVLQLFRGAGVETVRWPKCDEAAWGRREFAARTARLAWEMRRRRVDVVHCSDVTALTQQVVVAARLARAPIVCHIRNRNAQVSRSVARNLYAVRQFIFMSRATWDSFSVQVGPDEGTIIYDGVEIEDVPDLETARTEASAELRRELGLTHDARLIGMVARVEPQKDFTTLARAAALVAAEEPGVRFVIVGGTDLTPDQRRHFPEVKRVVAECGVERNFLFLGFRSDVPRLLRAMEISVLSTHWEGLPLVIWEAMAQATPVVATAVDGIPEVIEDGGSGLLVRHEDPAQLADRLLALLRDTNRARVLGSAGRARARALFSTERFAADVAEVYGRVLGAA